MANYIHCASFLPSVIDETSTNQLVVQIRSGEQWLTYASVKETADLPHVRHLLTSPQYRVMDMRNLPAPVDPTGSDLLQQASDMIEDVLDSIADGTWACSDAAWLSDLMTLSRRLRR